MFGILQILVTAPAVRAALAVGALVVLGACGQKGPLFLPTGEAAAGRATLPETLSPAATAVPAAGGASGLPPSGTAAPVRNR
jgi:predicted small lipoprotein YifL